MLVGLRAPIVLISLTATTFFVVNSLSVDLYALLPNEVLSSMQCHYHLCVRLWYDFVDEENDKDINLRRENASSIRRIRFKPTFWFLVASRGVPHTKMSIDETNSTNAAAWVEVPSVKMETMYSVLENSKKGQLMLELACASNFRKIFDSPRKCAQLAGQYSIVSPEFNTLIGIVVPIETDKLVECSKYAVAYKYPTT